jgi:hypothetical protein
VALDRLALRPFTFSNGMTIPAGTLISLPLCAIHMEEETYSNPDQFDGFRFTTLGDSMAKLQRLSIQRLVQPLTSWLLDLGNTRGEPLLGLWLFPESLCDDRHIL